MYFLRASRLVAVLVAGWLLFMSGTSHATERADFLASFLNADDLKSFTLDKDARSDGSHHTAAFLEMKGQYSGSAAWKMDTAAVVNFIEDKRYAFATEGEAKKYFEEEVRATAATGKVVSDADNLGETSRVFREANGQDETWNNIVRVGTVVGVLTVSIPPVAKKNAPAVNAIFAGKMSRRMLTALGGAAPAPKPAPTVAPPAEKRTLHLPSSGLTIEVAGEWEIERVDDEGGAADSITRLEPLPHIGAIVRMFGKDRKCATIIGAVGKGKGGARVFENPVEGYHPQAVEVEDEDNKASFQCAATQRGAMVVFTMPPIHESAEQRALLGTLLTAAKPVAKVIVDKPAPLPPSSPSPSPSPSPSLDDDDFDFDFGFPHFLGVRAQVDGAYIIPDDARDESFGLAATLDLGFVTGELIGFAGDFGVSMGYDFDGNVPFDLHAGVGFNLGLGPVSIVPLVGFGIDTRGAGEEATTHQMDMAFYWYPGGRLRLRFGPVALEGYVAAPFRGSITADQATDVGQTVRVVSRLCYYDDDETEYFAGFRYTKYIGATDDNDVLRYPGAEQFGGVLGIGFTLEEAFED